MRKQRFLSHLSFGLERHLEMNQSTVIDHLGIRITAVGPDFICGEMPVDGRTKQPFGLLHGGASIVLAETLGSAASSILAMAEGKAAVGVEVNGNHLRPAREGVVTGICRPLKLGGGLHIWTIDVFDQAGKQVCAARLTVALVG